MDEVARQRDSRLSNGGCVWLTLLLLLLAGCATFQGDGSGRGPRPPYWWPHPKPDDSFTLYEPAKAENCATEDSAVNLAWDRALNAFNKRLGTCVESISGSATQNFSVKALHDVKDTKVEHRHVVQHRGRWWAWVLVSYPREEFEQERERVERPWALYKDALGAMGRKEYRQAEQALRTITVDYAVGSQSVFPTGRAWLELARARAARNYPAHAHRFYDRILGFSDSQVDPNVKLVARKENGRLRKVEPIDWFRENLDGRKLAVVCRDRETGKAHAEGAAINACVRKYNLNTSLLNGYDADASAADLAKLAHADGAEFLLFLSAATDHVALYPGSKTQKVVGHVTWELMSTSDGTLLGSGSAVGAGKAWKTDTQALQNAVNVVIVHKLGLAVDWGK